MRRKKKGATLIFVIIIFTFVSLVSVGMLSMIAGNYTARVSESKRIENLYSSESGIDMAYNITGKTVGAGIKYGYFQVAELRCGTNKGPNQKYYTVLITDIQELKERIKKDQKKLELPTTDEEESKELFKDIEDCKQGIETDKKIIDKLYKEEFKRAFKFYIREKDEDDETSILIKSIDEKKYIDISLSYENETDAKDDSEEDIPAANKVNAKYTEYKVNFPNVQKGKDKDGNDREWPFLSVPSEPKSGLQFYKSDEIEKIQTKEESTGEVHEETVNIEVVTGKETYNFIIESEFLSTEPNSKVLGNNSRKVQAIYEIIVPEYDSLFLASAGELKDYNVLKRGLTIGGNMDVNNVNNLTVKGDIFVEGIERNSEQYSKLVDNYGKAYAKYADGIKINNSSVKFIPVDKNSKAIDSKDDDTVVNVNTRGTFNIQNKSKVTIGSNDSNSKDFDSSVTGNLYAANIFAGDIIGDSEFTDSSKFMVNNVITDNDLALRATNTHFTIQNFYGINDKNIQYNDGKNTNGEYIKYDDDESPNDKYIEYATDEDDKMMENVGKTSSSIIINGNKDAKSTVSITNEAYIMGTAHIATTGDYQTGESTAVKGNYIAYAVPVSPDEAFKYDKPLQVLDEDNIFKKAKHFNDFWNGKRQKGIEVSQGDVDDGGIILPTDTSKIHSVGAIVYKNSAASDETFVKGSTNYIVDDELKGGAVYQKRAEYAKQVFDLGIHDYEKDYDYINKYNDASVNINSIDKVDDVLGKLKADNIPDKNKNWSYALDQGQQNETPVAIFNPTTETITITNDLNAVIVTNGDVKIQGHVDFKGTIIAKGNLTVVDGSTVTIEYDIDTVNEVQKYNIDVFNDVFGQFTEIKDDNKESENKTLLKQVLDGQYDIKSYLVNKLWKLIQ